MQTITSQDYIDEEIVAAKMADKDFTVYVSPAFEVGGEVVRVLLDGHHSFEAAKLAGVEPEYITMDKQGHDAIALIEAGEYDDFLMAVHMGSDYRNIETGASVW